MKKFQGSLEKVRFDGSQHSQGVWEVQRCIHQWVASRDTANRRSRSQDRSDIGVGATIQGTILIEPNVSFTHQIKDMYCQLRTKNMCLIKEANQISHIYLGVCKCYYTQLTYKWLLCYSYYELFFCACINVHQYFWVQRQILCNWRMLTM